MQERKRLSLRTDGRFALRAEKGEWTGKGRQKTSDVKEIRRAHQHTFDIISIASRNGSSWLLLIAGVGEDGKRVLNKKWKRNLWKVDNLFVITEV